MKRQTPSHSFQEDLAAWLPAVVIMVVIYLLSNTARADLPDFGGLDFFVKKSGHFWGYAAFGLASVRALGITNQRRRWSALALVFFYALSDELHQSFIPGRTPWGIDILIDCLGATLSITLAPLWPRLWRLVFWGLKAPRPYAAG